MTKEFSNGVWPVMLTPFTEDKKVDELALKQLVDWYIEKKVDGLFAVCQSSEMFFLTNEEMVQITKKVVEYSAGRVPVIASGHTADSLQEQAEQIKNIHAAGAEAVVLITNRLAKEEESDAVWKENLVTLMDMIPSDIPLAFYECPYPYKRLVSPENLRWAAETGRFYFLKDTCCDIEQIKEKLLAIKDTKLKLFNANTTTLLESLRAGAAGYSGVMANFHPDLYVWLMENFETEQAKDLNAFLTVSSLIERQVYPVNAKHNLQTFENISIKTTCRTRDENELNETAQQEVQDLFMLTEKYRQAFLYQAVK